jgi:hypothetical protein
MKEQGVQDDRSGDELDEHGAATATYGSGTSSLEDENVTPGCETEAAGSHEETTGTDTSMSGSVTG